MGDLMLAPVPATPAAPLSPIVDRATGDVVVAYLEFQSAPDVGVPEVRMAIARSPSEPPLVSAVATVTPGADGWVTAQAVLPISGLASGPYLASAELDVAGATTGRIARPFTIGGR